jgi:CMP-N,N'-diacetyllegionaminic acid synthase
MTNVLAVVPARCGSKGIPHKNIAPCAGRPLIDWTLWAIADAFLVTESVVSTDCNHLMPDVFEGEYPQLEREISDEAQIEDRLDALIRGYAPDVIVLLQPTSPVRTGKQIDEAIEQLLREEADSLLSVVKSHTFLWSPIDGSSHWVNYDWQNRPQRQQITKEYFEENGSIYVFTSEHWERTHNRLGGKISLYEMPEECRVQVDSPFDLFLAEQILSRQEAAVVH